MDGGGLKAFISYDDRSSFPSDSIIIGIQILINIIKLNFIVKVEETLRNSNNKNLIW